MERNGRKRVLERQAVLFPEQCSRSEILTTCPGKRLHIRAAHDTSSDCKCTRLYLTPVRPQPWTREFASQLGEREHGACAQHMTG